MDYDLENKFFKLKTPADLLYILSFYGLDGKIEILQRKLLAIERVYEGKRAGYRNEIHLKKMKCCQIKSKIIRFQLQQELKYNIDGLGICRANYFMD